MFCIIYSFPVLNPLSRADKNQQTVDFFSIEMFLEIVSFIESKSNISRKLILLSGYRQIQTKSNPYFLTPDMLCSAGFLTGCGCSLLAGSNENVSFITLVSSQPFVKRQKLK